MRLRPLAALILVIVTVGCAYKTANRWEPHDESLERPSVERIDANSVRLRWPEAFANGPVDVFTGLSPDAIDRTRALARASGSELILSNVDSPFVDRRFRLYYELIPSGGGAPVVAAERQLPLEGLDNFRDLGGYTTADGHTVRWNRLYRSNDLSGLTSGDIEYLTSIGIKLICDFRSERERIAAPDREFLPAGAPQVQPGYDPPQWLNLTVEQTGLDPQGVREQIQSGTLSALAVRRVMRQAYRSFVTDYADQWAELFHKIAGADNLPTVVHCTAGKDRTGFASALILLALGVPEQTVFEDYMLTNQYRRNFYAFVLRWVSLYSLFRTNPDDLIPLLEARPEYLRESLDAIHEGYGSVEHYLEAALDVTPAMMLEIRENLLQMGS